MNEPIRPKLKPKTAQPTPEQILKPVVELVVSELETGGAPGLDHIASLGGLELLVEIAKVGEQAVAPRHTSNNIPHPADPRRCVDPRKRILPR
jgi:hypothetical protein